MMNFMRVLCVSAAVTLAPVAAFAETPAAAIAVTDAYSFAVPAGAKTAAAFMTLNYAQGGAAISPDRLLRAESAVAGKVELHTSVIENDVMSMRPLESLPLPPTGSFVLKPQGVHIMLMDLKKNFVAGESFPLTLVFEKAGAVPVEVDVRAPGDSPAVEEKPHEHHEGDGHDHGHDHGAEETKAAPALKLQEDSHGDIQAVPHDHH